MALWNEKDPILKERIFGLTGNEGNHGEDPKECYYYLDSTPTHSYMKALYKYPQSAYPYTQIVEGNRARSVHDPELELEETGVFDECRYWDVQAEYAKAAPEDILIRITVANRGPDIAKLHLLPTLWYRNTWIWGCKHEGCTAKPLLKQVDDCHVRGKHETLQENHFYVGPHPDNGSQPVMLWTENETNTRRLFGVDNYTSYTKDAFHRYMHACMQYTHACNVHMHATCTHRYIVDGEEDAINPNKKGTKVSPYYVLEVGSGEERVVKLRLTNTVLTSEAFGEEFDEVFTDRIREADDFFAGIMPKTLGPQQQLISRQAYAGKVLSL